jgi:hypothetical protein
MPFGRAALAFGYVAISLRRGPHTLRLLAAAMDIVESLADLLCDIGVQFVFFCGLLMSLGRTLSGLLGTPSSLTHPIICVLLGHSSWLPTHALLDTTPFATNASHDRDCELRPQRARSWATATPSSAQIRASSPPMIPTKSSADRAVPRGRLLPARLPFLPSTTRRACRKRSPATCRPRLHDRFATRQTVSAGTPV